MNDYGLRIDPESFKEITPIMEDMTRVEIANKNTPAVQGKKKKADWIIETEKSCVHMDYVGNEPCHRITRTSDGTLVCQACGRVIYNKFDQSAIDRVMACIEVVNQALFFGIANGLKVDMVRLLLNLKRELPELSTFVGFLNEYVKRTEVSKDSVENLGIEYNTRNITGLY